MYIRLTFGSFGWMRGGIAFSRQGKIEPNWTKQTTKVQSNFRLLAYLQMSDVCPDAKCNDVQTQEVKRRRKKEKKKRNGRITLVQFGICLPLPLLLLVLLLLSNYFWLFFFLLASLFRSFSILFQIKMMLSLVFFLSVVSLHLSLSFSSSFVDRIQSGPSFFHFQLAIFFHHTIVVCYYYYYYYYYK